MLEGSPRFQQHPLYLQVSTHGYSQNQILVWKYPSLTQVAKLTGHSYRVLYLVSLCWQVLDPVSMALERQGADQDHSLPPGPVGVSPSQLLGLT